MLQSLREHASSWLFKTLLGFLIVSFGAWGIGDVFLGDRDPVVSKVGGIGISANDLNKAFQDEMRRAQQMFPQGLDTEQAKQFGLLDSALQRLQDRILFSLAARDLGIPVSDDVVRQEISREQAFHNSQGQFDPTVFQQVLAASGFTEASYVSQLRLDLATSHLSSAITANVPVPSAMLDALYRYHAEKRVAEYISIPKSGAGDVGQPSDQDLEAFYKGHADQFTAPELRSAVVLRLDPKALAEGIKVSDDQIKQAYDSRIKEFTIPDRREIEQAVFSDRAQADAASKAVAGGKSFADAVRDVSGGKVSVVKLGVVERADMLGDVAGPAFEAKPGSVTAPIKSPLGWHLIHVVREEKGRVQPLSEVAGKLRSQIAERQAQDSMRGLADKLDDALGGGATLQEAGQRLGLPVTTVANIDARGMDASGKPVAAASDPNIVRLIFQTPEDQDSQLTDIGNDALAVVHVDKISPSQPRPLADIKAEAIAAWQADKRAQATKARADAILEKLKGGAPFTDVAKAEKLAVKTTPAFDRSTHDSETGLPLSLTAQIFTLKPGESAEGEAPDAFVVARLKDIQVPDPVKDPQTRAQVSETLSRSIGADLVDEFVQGLRNRYNVTVRRDVLASRF
jgi:peptidyl-prolyl cis-trans isomerase D